MKRLMQTRPASPNLTSACWKPRSPVKGLRLLLVLQRTNSEGGCNFDQHRIALTNNRFLQLTPLLAITVETSGRVKQRRLTLDCAEI